LKYANFFKKSGFYGEALQRIEKLESENIQDRELLFRVVRDKARALSILNRSKESIETFERAVTLLGDDYKTNIKYGKLLFIQALASKRISSDKALETFTQALNVFESIL